MPSSFDWMKPVVKRGMLIMSSRVRGMYYVNCALM